MLEELAVATNSHLVYEVKKSLDPISVICISAGTFALGGIAKGFFSKLGADSYELLKSKLRKLLSQRKDGEKEKLLELEFSVERGPHLFHVTVIATNPSGDDIDALLQKHLDRLDDNVINAFDERIGLKKLVYEVRDGNIELKFGVRRDCVPLAPRSSEPNPTVNSDAPQAARRLP